MLVPMKCPSCGASLEVSDTDIHVTCRYCNQSVRTRAPAQAQPVPPVQAWGAHPQVPVTGFRSATPQYPSNAGGAKRAYIWVSFAVTAGLMSMVGMTTAWRRTSANSPALIGARALAGRAAAVDTSLLAWHSREDPMPIAIPASAGIKEGFFTGLRRLAPNDSLYFALVDTKTRSEVWRTPSLGSYSEGYQGAHALIFGNRAVYTDSRNSIHIVDLATGHEERTGTFSDRARRLCALSTTQVIVDTSDEKPVSFDLTSGVRKQITTKELPPTCRDRFHVDVAHPQVPGFSIRGSLSEGSTMVAWGYKAPGTSTVSVFGLDPKSKSVRWQSVLAPSSVSANEGSGGEFARLVSGRLFIEYKARDTDDENHLAAFDASSGKRLWDTALQGIFSVDSVEGIGASDQHVYVHRMSIIDVLDAKEGTVEGTFLHTTYDTAFHRSTSR
jgi:outer membrane protein assembly factor BamB